LVRIKVHDPDARRRLVVIYGPMVYGWCRRAGLQPNDAMDMVQEVFRAVAVADATIPGYNRERPNGKQANTAAGNRPFRCCCPNSRSS
jgi:RNA polymerase sigma-70 factor (ECF subfamily)